MRPPPQNAPSSPVRIERSPHASPAGSPSLAPVDPAELAKQNEVMKNNVLKARERREAEEREQERLRKERAEAKLKQLEDAKPVQSAKTQPIQDDRWKKEAPPSQSSSMDKAPLETSPVSNGGLPADISQQEQMMKSTAQQARERREAEERE